MANAATNAIQPTNSTSTKSRGKNKNPLYSVYTTRTHFLVLMLAYQHLSGRYSLGVGEVSYIVVVYYTYVGMVWFNLCSVVCSIHCSYCTPFSSTTVHSHL